MNNAAPPDISSCLPAMSQVMPPTGNGPGYFINFTRSPIYKPFQFPNLNFQPGMPEVRRYYLFRSNESSPGGYVTCLTPSHIDFFRDGVVKIIVDDYNTNTGFWAGKYFVDCDVYYDFLTNGTQNMEHHLRFRVATFIQ